LPPYFSKKNYNYAGNEILFLDRDPLEVLLEHNPTSTTEYVQKIIRNYRKKSL
jgi:hypothetical protein